MKARNNLPNPRRGTNRREQLRPGCIGAPAAADCLRSR